MKRLWEVLLRLSEGEKGDSLSCEDCYMLLDCLSDLMADGYRPREVMPLAEKYLRRCPDCMREYIQSVRELLPPPSPGNGDVGVPGKPETPSPAADRETSPRAGPAADDVLRAS